MWLFLVAALVVCAVVAIGAALNSGPKPQHARPRHLAAVPDPPGWGSMILAEERALRLPDQETRALMLAELSPEALDRGLSCAAVHLDGVCPGYPGPPEDPGAGDEVSSEPPAPAPDPDGRPGDLSQSDPPPVRADWLAAQMAGLYAWVREQYAAGAAA